MKHSILFVSSARRLKCCITGCPESTNSGISTNGMVRRDFSAIFLRLDSQGAPCSPVAGSQYSIRFGIEPLVLTNER